MYFMFTVFSIFDASTFSESDLIAFRVKKCIIGHNDDKYIAVGNIRMQFIAIIAVGDIGEHRDHLILFRRFIDNYFFWHQPS